MKNILGELNSRVKIAEGSIRPLWEQNNKFQPLFNNREQIQQEKINRASEVCSRIISKIASIHIIKSSKTQRIKWD